MYSSSYSMVDTVVVGKFVGTNALAGVGATGTISFLIIGFLMGMSTGFTVLTSQRFGAGDMKGMRKTVASAAILSLIVSVVMTLVSVIGMHGLLKFLNTPDDIYDAAYSYIIIVCAGIVFQVLYNLLSSILRALGNSKTPLYFLILAALLNIVLDLVFIIAFHMGTAGAAYATVISQGISGFLCLYYIIKKVPVLRMEKEDWHINWHLAKIQMSIGFPMAFQYSITAIGTMTVQWALNLLGSTAVAAFTAANKIEQIVTQAYVALGTAIAAPGEQSGGAGKVKRIRQGFHAGCMMGCAYAVVTGLIVAFFGKYLTYLFVDPSEQNVVQVSVTYFRTVFWAYPFLGSIFLYRNTLQGMGYGLVPMLGGVFELVARTLIVVLVAGHTTFAGVCLADPAAWIAALIPLIPYYFYTMKKYSTKAE